MHTCRNAASTTHPYSLQKMPPDPSKLLANIACPLVSTPVHVEHLGSAGWHAREGLCAPSAGGCCSYSPSNQPQQAGPHALRHVLHKLHACTPCCLTLCNNNITPAPEQLAHALLQHLHLQAQAVRGRGGLQERAPAQGRVNGGLGPCITPSLSSPPLSSSAAWTVLPVTGRRQWRGAAPPPRARTCAH